MNYDLIESTERLFIAAIETMKKKNADYAGDASSMRNFELSADVAGITMSKGILVRLMDKMTRIGNLIERDAAVKDESIFDTIQDAINYSAILLHALRIESEEINKGEIEVGDDITILPEINHERVHKYIPGQRGQITGKGAEL